MNSWQQSGKGYGKNISTSTSSDQEELIYKNEGYSSYDQGTIPPEQWRKKEVQNGNLGNFSLQASIWFWTP